MIRYQTQSEAPHLLIELDDAVSGAEVRRELAGLPDDLQTLPDDFVALVSHPDVILFKANAVGPLFYFVAYLFDADPGLCVFVDGGRSPHPGLRAFIEQIGLDDQVAFVQTLEEADDHIQQYLQARTERPRRLAPLIRSTSLVNNGNGSTGAVRKLQAKTVAGVERTAGLARPYHRDETN